MNKWLFSGGELQMSTIYSQHQLIRCPIIRTFANSNGFLIPFLLFPFKIHPIIRTFAISNKFFGPVGVRINGCLLYGMCESMYIAKTFNYTSLPIWAETSMPTNHQTWNWTSVMVQFEWGDEDGNVFTNEWSLRQICVLGEKSVYDTYYLKGRNNLQKKFLRKKFLRNLFLRFWPLFAKISSAKKIQNWSIAKISSAKFCQNWSIAEISTAKIFKQHGL